MKNKSVILTDGSRRIELHLSNISGHDSLDCSSSICVDNGLKNQENVSICLHPLEIIRRQGVSSSQKTGFFYGDENDHKTEQLIDLVRFLLAMNDPVEAGLEGHYIDIILYLLPGASFKDEGNIKAPKEQKIIRITEYIDKHIKTNISVQELMAISNMSERALYYLFREVQGTTPLAFIRRRKIEHLQRELYDHHSTRNITQIAMDYGFTNLGRFADLYRKQVGELPSETRLKYA